MKITKRQLRRIIKEEKRKLLSEKRFTDDRAFMDAMKTIIDTLMQLDPKSRVKNAESLIQNIETIIDQASKETQGGVPPKTHRTATEEESGIPDSQRSVIHNRRPNW